jgi:hypothetical protein
MKFVIDGNGTMSYRAARDLLKDMIRPYDNPVLVTGYMHGPASDNVMTAINDLDDIGVVKHSMVTTSLLTELESPGDKTLVVVGDVRPDLVSYCWEHDIQVLDLTRGLYPVKM